MATDTMSVTFRYSHTIGQQTSYGPGFYNPTAIALGKEDRIYVASRSMQHRPDAKRVTVLTAEEEYIGEFAHGTNDRNASDSAADGSLIWPSAIAQDEEGNVYVADEWLNRISIFTADGDWIGKWGTFGRGDGEIDRPCGLAFDQDDNLYLADGRNNRIQKFTKDGSFLAKWGREGAGDGEFSLPWGIDIDRNGDVYIADWRNDRIQKFTPDGRFLMKFGSFGRGDGQFNRPTGIAVDKEGVIYVTDWGNDRLEVFDRTGHFIASMTGDATISKWGVDKLNANPGMWKQRIVAHALEREKLFWGPIAVEVDDQGQIFVLESARHRIQVYRKIVPSFLGLYDDGRL